MVTYITSCPNKTGVGDGDGEPNKEAFALRRTSATLSRHRARFFIKSGLLKTKALAAFVTSPTYEDSVRLPNMVRCVFAGELSPSYAG